MTPNNDIASEFVEHMDWSSPKTISTRSGPRQVRMAPPAPAFWTAWRECKECVKEAGFSVTKVGSEWVVTQWLTYTGAPKAEAPACLPAVEHVPVPPGLSLLPYQTADVRRMAGMGGVLLASEQGTGKTVQIAALCNAVRAERILIVAPARLLLNWRAELATWLLNPAPAIVIEAKAADEIETAMGPIIVSYETAVRPGVIERLRSIAWDVVTFDEAQALNNHASGRTKALIGSEAPLLGRHRILATGTPFKNRPVELWPLLRYLEPQRWSSRHAYGLRYCAAFEGPEGWDYTGSCNLDELNQILRDGVMIRRTKAEVLPDLPPKHHRLVVIEPTGEQRGLIEAELRNVGAVDPDSIARSMADFELDPSENLARVRAALAVSKSPAIARHIEGIIREGEKVIVFVHHREAVEALATFFGEQAVVIIGGQSPKATHKAVTGFQTDPGIMVAVCSIRAAGAGLTLTAAHRVVFGECDWSPGVMAQAEDRAHRIGQRHPVVIEHVVLDGSLDRLMHGVTAKKRRAAAQAFK